ncbi:unnamed protein product [Acanthoscelides obtectus]|uniref:BESS domain-containing protein n=1 Tax=Acanthoscelides obtectus TaxID=200917 RepID=A0A9P0PZL7_ACAOB|nr:unnamed protein product [Acanthoscelides obtectus]CAK1680552.1 hypothetical protein AOBTE_LOCUS32752 [Acanthoscelides obtectus]
MKAAQTKWKNLRDYFRRELKKIPIPRLGDPGDIATKSHWTHFKSLLFLKDQFKPRVSTGNLVDSQNELLDTDMQSDVNSDDDRVETETIDEMQDTLNVEPATPTSVSSENVEDSSTGTSGHFAEPRTVLKSRLRKRKNNIADLVAIEKHKLEFIRTKRANIEETKEDDHLAFFKSLLPHVKKIPDNNILPFRNSVQDLVQRYAYGYTIQMNQGLQTFDYQINQSDISY